MTIRLLRRGCLVLLAAALLSITVSFGVWAAGPDRVVILPFTTNSKEDISYLVKGLRDMLATRLAWQDRVQVIEPDLVAPVLKKIPPPYSDKKAREVGKELSAQAVVFGSITMLGKSISVDARVVRVNDDSPALTAFVQAAEMDQVIPSINDFAERINAEIFRRPEAVAAQKAKQQEGASDVVARASVDVQSPAEQWSDTRASEQQDTGEGGVDKLPPNISPLNPLFLRNLSGIDSDRYWRSPRIKGTITSLSVGDIDLDGKNEIVALMTDGIKVYRLAGAHFAMVNEFKDGPAGDYLFVDVGDVDGNGRPEIYVTNVHFNSIESFVLEWHEGGFKYKAKDVPYYFRIQPNPEGEGIILLGQRKTLNKAYSGPVYQMGYKENEIAPIKEVSDIDGVNVLGMALADLNGAGKPMILSISPGFSLRVFTRKGEKVWVSSEAYGASAKIIKLPPGSTIDSTREDENVWIWVPTRLLISDLDLDKRADVVVVRNKDSLMGFMENLRNYFQGTLYSLYWNGMSMMEDWRTPRISGNVTDYAIADVGNVGRPALIMGVVQSSFDDLLRKGTSHIVAFTLKPQKRKKPTGESGL